MAKITLGEIKEMTREAAFKKEVKDIIYDLFNKTGVVYSRNDVVYGDCDLCPSGGSDHNTLSGIQGGMIGQYFHLDSSQLAVVNNLTTLGTPTQQIRVNAGGTALEYFTVTSSVDEEFVIAMSIALS